MEDNIEIGSGDFMFSNTYACVGAGKHFKSISANGCCRNCGGNKIHFIPKIRIPGRPSVDLWDDILDNNG
jgi:hypothetical protein